MGKYCKDNYAGTYAAKNVKQALDKLIDVLQSPEQVRRLVIGQGPKKPIKPSKIAFETPAMTPLWMETSASMAKKSSNLDSEKGSTPSSSDDPSDRRKTSSSRSSSRCSDSSRHISIARYHQGLREYPEGGSLRAVTASTYRQKSNPLEAGWSSAPCKSGYLDVFVTDTFV
ncbi:hypothetical protein KC19_N019800 [Ceratodon purpureus]|nr:hypothetical protein KC19_N019800 [Ceratodon purpureus]